MGDGRWDTTLYKGAVISRAAAGVDDFAYTKDAVHVHPNLDAMRINSKPFQKLESRDSVEHPQSRAIILAFDVTGSNQDRAVVAQKYLPQLMEKTMESLPDPQVAIWANDDFETSGKECIQASDFESDIRVDEHIRNTWLIGQGGGNHFESYDLLFYLAARKTVIDCFEKRGQRGYMFVYADEPFPTQVSRNQVRDVFGDSIEANIPISEIIAEASQLYNIFVMWPSGSSYKNAYNQYVDLFGRDHVLQLQAPEQICELVASTIATEEAKAKGSSPVATVAADGGKPAATRVARL